MLCWIAQLAYRSVLWELMLLGPLPLPLPPWLRLRGQAQMVAVQVAEANCLLGDSKEDCALAETHLPRRLPRHRHEKLGSTPPACWPMLVGTYLFNL